MAVSADARHHAGKRAAGQLQKADLVATKAKAVLWPSAGRMVLLDKLFSTEAARSSKAWAGPPSRTPAFVDLKFFYGPCEHLSVDQKPWDIYRHVALDRGESVHQCVMTGRTALRSEAHFPNRDIG